MHVKIPQEVKDIARKLEMNNHKAFLVGGCVRDLLLKREPKDWDVATDAKPEVVQKLFIESVYENKFGTVGVKTRSADDRLKVVEITTFRIEGKYSDKRHPDEVKFAKTINEDLSRRDFTINAIALELNSARGREHRPDDLLLSHDLQIVDPYEAQADLKIKSIRAVGNPQERFEEDALRLLRAVRFAVELGFDIEKETAEAIKQKAPLLEFIAKERIRDEMVKMIMAERAAEGIIMLEDLRLLQFVMPELREGIGCGQNKHHIYTVFDHNTRALNYAAEKGYSLVVRLASLLHDVGKPRTKRGEGLDSTFYSHEMVGARMATQILDRLHFSKELVEAVSHLVRCHLFYYNVGEVTAAGVRRFLARVGSENIDDLIKVREADRIGSGVPKAIPYKIRHLLFMIEKVKHDPVHPKMLKLRGDDVMRILGINPSPRIGAILLVLLEEVLDDPKKNIVEFLEQRVKELGLLSDNELDELAVKARERKEEFEGGIEEDMKKKHHVK
ncbi:HD domain-containing protein [Candidatus Jorgensenbacteria bacterium]|nr:HD domain-containing protein [Candidatus Jorgensenbacteria bacterium]